MAKKATQSAFKRLQSLASEPSSETRRELLREITDMFLGDPSHQNEKESMLFDEVVAAVVKDMESVVRAELSDKLADATAPIGKTLKRFAMDDDIEVARPVLERSRSLSDEDLIEVVASKTQEHMLAITRREEVSESVSGALVDRGSDAVVASLLDNSGAEIGRDAMEKVTDRAMRSEVLQKSFVNRDAVPLDLLNELTMVVQKDLRNEILKRFENVSTEELDKALAKGRHTVRMNHRKVSREQQMAAAQIKLLEQSRKLNLDLVLKYLQDGNVSFYAEALGRLSGIGYDNALKIYKERDVDSLALAMKALDAPLPLFATTAAYIAGVSNAVAQVQNYAEVYKAVPAESARRAIRFWKVRASASQAA
jgi:uncharacterized protein (DUF2336 family)